MQQNLHFLADFWNLAHLLPSMKLMIITRKKNHIQTIIQYTWSQSALSETNWPLRVLGCSPYLESLPSYTDGAPPWTPTNWGHGITSRPLKRSPEGLT
ncbi:hypothetical protein DEO72_LG2g3052 [Vigna unguiculata]|uniref:Uncharacterized protein n=1 Tax=Vigna unguiculata TaxID=3917 RepID=A0A4D6L2H3_VIGUN|nr:hypothetical protein DEO72_LG2g3052 [Vigna unguiculata]